MNKMKSFIKINLLLGAALLLNACGPRLNIADSKKAAIVGFQYNQVIDSYDPRKDIRLINVSPDFVNFLRLNKSVAEDLETMFSTALRPLNLIDPALFVTQPGYKEWAQSRLMEPENNKMDRIAGKYSLEPTKIKDYTSCRNYGSMKLDFKDAFKYLPSDVDLAIFIEVSSNLDLSKYRSQILGNGVVIKDFKVYSSVLMYMVDRNGKIVFTSSKMAKSDNSIEKVSKELMETQDDQIEKLFLRASYKAVQKIRGKIDKKLEK